MEQEIKNSVPIPSGATRKKFRFIIGLLYAAHFVVIGALALFFLPNPELVVLRYNVYFGIDILSAWWQVYLIPLLSLVFTSANIFLARRFLNLEQKLLSILFLLGSCVITLGLIIAVAAIVLINY